MKKFLLLALLLLMTSCDFGTESKKDVPNVPPKDTTKVLVQKTVVVNDTNISKTHTLNISGKLSEKNSSGNTIGSFSDAVVCLESSGKCVKPNTKGQYSFAPLKTSSLFGARSLAQSDTTQTPETIVQDTVPDTTIVITKNITVDTLIRNDTIFILDTTIIVHNMYLDNDTSVVDSVIVYSDSRVLYEIPVTSWKTILPDAYVVQRNISGYISVNGFEKETKNVEAIYWSVDSIALRIPLELSNDKLSYSGFVYQAYDDSSFRFAIKNKNLFVRIVDQNDSVFGISNVVTYSERSGDLSIFLKPIIPGAILRYPRPNAFRVINDGENVIKILSDTLIRNSSTRWYDLDSINYRTQFSKIDLSREGLKIAKRYVANDSISYFATQFSDVDSVSFRFESDSSFYADFTFSPDSAGIDYTHKLKIEVGNNSFNFNSYDPTKWVSSKFLTMLEFDLRTVAVTNLKVFVKFKS